ncbi:MAG: hypothetical protein VW546_10935, partial [Gammaproteobacteria bacterium]
FTDFYIRNQGPLGTGLSSDRCSREHPRARQSLSHDSKDDGFLINTNVLSLIPATMTGQMPKKETI